MSAMQADYEARKEAAAPPSRVGPGTEAQRRRPPVEHEFGSLGGPILRVGAMRIELLTARGSPPPTPDWVPRNVVDDATSGRLPPGPHLLPYVWPAGFQGALIVDVGTRTPVLGQSIRFYRLYPDDLGFWAHYTRGDEKAAATLQQHWHTRNLDMWHYVKDLRHPPEYAEAELQYIDDQVFKALVGAFATVLGAGAGIGQVGAGVARAGAPRAAGRLEPGEQAWSMQRQYGKQLREFGETLEQETAQARTAAQAGKGSGGGGGSLAMAETLQAAPGGRVGTATTPVPVPGTGQAVPAPSLAERGGWGGSSWGGMVPTKQPLPGVRESLSRAGGAPLPPVAPRIAVAPPPPVTTLILPGASRPAGPVGDPPVKDAEQRLPAPEGTPPGIKGDPPVRERVEAPAPAGSTGEMRLSAEQVRWNERAIDDLERRIGDLEGTEAPHDLIAELDRIDPHAPDAARRIRLLLGRVRRWEGAKPEPAGPGVGELTEESEAARRATLGARAERVEANKMQGSSGETQVFYEIASGQSIPELGVPVTLIGSQVYIRTSTGLRIVDFLVRLPSGKIVALEVKTGGAVRDAYQLDADLALATAGGTIVGTGAPGMNGPIGPTGTVVLQR